MRLARALLPLFDVKIRIPSGAGVTHGEAMFGLEMRIERVLEQEKSPRLISGHKDTSTNIPPLISAVKTRNARRWFSLTTANAPEDGGVPRGLVWRAGPSLSSCVRTAVAPDAARMEIERLLDAVGGRKAKWQTHKLATPRRCASRGRS
jgi:hypothetical protein